MSADEQTFDQALAGGDNATERFCDTYRVVEDGVELTVYRPALGVRAMIPRWPRPVIRLTATSLAPAAPAVAHVG